MAEDSGSQTERRETARGAAKVVAFVVGLRTLGVWSRVCSVSRNFIMENYCLED